MNAPPPAMAPGPPGHRWLGHIPEFRRDVLGLLDRSARTCGDVVRFRLGPQVVHLLNHPDHAAHVLQRNARNYDKRTRSAQYIKRVTGESLLTANGEFWQRQRRLLQPAFHHHHIDGFAGTMTSATSRMLADWSTRAAAGATIDVASEMMRLTYTIVGRTLFSAEVGPDAATIERAMQVILPATFGRLGRIVNWPDWVPVPENRRFARALHDIDRVVYRMIEEHRQRQADGEPDHDLLSMLLRVRDGDAEAGLTDRQLRNETITFLLAGHETTANALAWTFYLLAQNPEVEERLRQEVETVLTGRVPVMADLAQLSWTRAVVQESMRLFPPIWIMERRVVADDIVGGFHLPAGSSVVISPYTLHRHPAFWTDPDRFDPTRFQHGASAAYIPFGAGPRFCIGSGFAMMEAVLITAMTVQAFRLKRVPGHPVEPLPGITLRMRHGLVMTAHRVTAGG